jgi:hypothetical protein
MSGGTGYSGFSGGGAFAAMGGGDRGYAGSMGGGDRGGGGGSHYSGSIGGDRGGGGGGSLAGGSSSLTLSLQELYGLPPEARSVLYKTEMCKNYAASGSCPFAG